MHGGGWWQYITYDERTDRPHVNRDLLRRVAQIARPYLASALLTLGAILAISLLGLVPPLLIRQMIDYAIPQRDLRALNLLALGMVLIPLLSGVIGVGQRYLNARIGEGIISDLRQALYAHMQRMSLRFFTHTKTGELMSRLNNDVVEAQRAVTSTFIEIITNTVTVLTTLAIMFSLEWRLTILSVIIFPLFFLPARRIGLILRHIVREAMDRNASMNAMMHETLNVSGAVLTKLFGRQADEIARFIRLSNAVRDIGVRRAVVGRWFFMMLSAVSAVGTALVFWSGGHLVIGEALTLGTLVAFTSYLAQLYGPLGALSNARVDFAQSLVSFERVFEVLDLPVEIEDAPGAIALERVHGHFRSFFDAGAEEPPPALDPGTDGPTPAAFTAKLQELGFADPQHIAARLREWTSGRLPALRAERARELLDQLLPHLFGALGALPEPDKAFALFDTLLARQRAGVQLLSLFTRHPALLQRVAAVLGAAPALAEQLAEDPQALEGLLSPSARFAAPKPVLRRQLAEAEDLEQATEITRRFVRQEEFHLSVATLEGRIDADAAGRLRTALAESALSLLLPRVLAAHKARYGRVRGARFAVVAMGKAGAGEMLAGSDLDLMLIYDYAPADIAPTPYFVRLSHAFTAALTAQGKEGQLYHIDMRLRPSGNHGPVAVSLEAFRRYHAQESWTWERLALTRARVLAATPGFAKVVEEAIRGALERAQSAEAILKDTADMRDRLAAELPPRGMFDVKALPGGMMEVVFVAQALQLVHGPRQPEIFQPNTAAALRALEQAELLDEPDAALLLRADHLWRTVQGVNRITGLSERASDPPAALAAPLLRATGTADFAELRLVMTQTAAQVQACFNRIIRRGDTT